MSLIHLLATDPSGGETTQLKNASKIGLFPRVGVKIRNIKKHLKPPPSDSLLTSTYQIASECIKHCDIQ